MDTVVLKEIKQLKFAISQLIGTSELATNDRFSKGALSRVAKDFQKLSIERGDWISDHDIHKVIKGAPLNPGKLLISQFGFKNYFKRGHTRYFYKPDLIAFNSELKRRNINLTRYLELKQDQEKFKKYLSSVQINKTKGSKKVPFAIKPELRDITSSSIPMPPAEKILEDLQQLKEKFNTGNLGDYIDVYESSHAMLKSMYYFEKYIDPQIKKSCKKWCENYNYAIHALSLITGEKGKFPLTD